MREYRVWTKEEEHALRLGVAKHGSGAWELIRTDPDFNATLSYATRPKRHGLECLGSDLLCTYGAAARQARSGIQLKDKWRNLVKFNHLSEAELNLGPKSRLQQSRTSQRTPVTPVMADADVPERPTRHRSRKSTHATQHATTTTHTYTPPPTPSPTQPPAHTTPTSAPAVGKISREQALLDHVLQLTDGAAAATGATQPAEQNNNCDDTTRSTPSSASGERKFTAFLGTRSRSSFEAELAADAIAAQILTSVPASLVPSMFNSGEDAAETGRKRTCVSPEGGQNANTATAAPANEQGSATASAEMSAEKNAGTSMMENQASLKGPLDALQLETNGKNGTYYSPQSKQPLLAAVQHHSRLDASAACPVSAPLSAIHPLRYAESSAANAPAATATTAAAAIRGANPAAAAATDRSALIALSAAAAAAAAAGSPGSTPAGTPPAAPPADPAAWPATHVAHASIAAASGPGLLETTAMAAPNSHKNVLPDDQNPHVRASQPKAEPCGSPSTQQGSPNAADDSIATSQPFSTEFYNTTSNNDAHTSDRQQQSHAAAAAAAAAAATGAAALHRPHPTDAAAYPPSNGLNVNTSAMNPVRSPPALDSSKTTKLTGTGTPASPPSQAPAITGCAIKTEPHSSQQQPPCAGGIFLQHAGISGLSVDQNGVVYLRGHGLSSGGGACIAAGVSGDQEERSGRTAGDTEHADKQSPPPPQIPALLNAAAAATVALSDENAHQDDAGGTARDVLGNGLGHHAAVSCAVAGAADETCMEASCIETPVHAPIPAHVLEKVQGIMARHKYSVLRVLPGGQAQLLAELAKGKQFVYFSPFEVEQMIVVEKTRSDSE